MFKVDEFVVHITGGICQVTKIAPLEMEGADKEKKYYFLVPLKTSASKVFVPVDNDYAIRRVMTLNEAEDLLDAIPSIQAMTVDNEKLRETRYKEAIRSCDCKELISVIKNLNERRLKRIEEGKKTTTTDEKYFKIAEENLYSELAFALGVEKKEMHDIVFGRMNADII